MKTLDLIRSRPHVAFVDDERNIGNSLIVTLGDGYCFKAEPGCGTRGYDTVTEAERESRASEVYQLFEFAASPNGRTWVVYKAHAATHSEKSAVGMIGQRDDGRFEWTAHDLHKGFDGDVCDTLDDAKSSLVKAAR